MVWRFTSILKIETIDRSLENGIVGNSKQASLRLFLVIDESQKDLNFESGWWFKAF